LEQHIHYGEYECDKDDATLSRKPDKTNGETPSRTRLPRRGELDIRIF
jgi:hypothetical protein